MGDTDQESARFEKKPDGYLGRAVTVKDGGKRANLARARRIVANPQPDPQAPRVGGRWQDENGTFNMLINQAGAHIECWITPSSSPSSRSPRPIFRLGGDRKSSTEFELYVYPNPAEFGGKLTHVSDQRLRVQLRKGTQRQTAVLIPNSESGHARPTLSEAALALFPPPLDV